MATTYQVQYQQVLEDGTVIYINPINDAMDTTVGRLSNGVASKLPGEDKNEMLQETLRNIRAHLYNIKDISAKLRRLSASVTDATDATIPDSSVTYGLHSRLSAAETSIGNINTSLAGKAPTNHASTATTYGGGTGEKYGHVKLSDLYASQANTTGAASSVGASQLAVYNAYNTLNGAKAPNAHASTATTYGAGSSANYGHVKTYDITNTTTDPTTSTDTAQVATRRALYNIWKRLADKDSAQDTNIAGKASISHASTTNSYGVGTTSRYGHLKISNTYNETSPSESASGVSAAMAASSYALRAAYNSLKTSIAGKAPTSHASTATTYGIGTASRYGHVKLSDTYTSGQTASNGVGASTKALYDVYSLVSGLQTTVNTLNSKIRDIYEYHTAADGEVRYKLESGVYLLEVDMDKPVIGIFLVQLHFVNITTSVGFVFIGGGNILESPTTVVSPYISQFICMMIHSYNTQKYEKLEFILRNSNHGNINPPPSVKYVTIYGVSII